MTQVFRPDGSVVPVTRIQAGPCVVTQRKTLEKDGVDSLQLGFGEQKKFRLNQAEQGHLEGLMTVRYLRDVRATDLEKDVKRGDMLTVKTFAAGDKVNVIGWSKGKGFQGVVKRHGFRGGPKTHGHKDNLRMPGTIGAGGVQRVFKNVRMGGHMGDEQITVKNLEIVQVLPEENALLVKGAVPGARGGLLIISSQAGEMRIEAAEEQPTAEVQMNESGIMNEESGNDVKVRNEKF